MEEQVTVLIAKVLQIPSDRVRDDSDLIDDLGADSLSLARLAAGIDEELDVRLPAERLQYIVSVRDLLNEINAASSAPSGGSGST